MDNNSTRLGGCGEMMQSYTANLRMMERKAKVGKIRKRCKRGGKRHECGDMH